MTIENENQKLMMSSKEAAKSLGVSFPTLKKLIKRENHPIPVLRTGTVRGHILIPYESLQQWVSEEIELQKNRKA